MLTVKLAITISEQFKLIPSSSNLILSKHLTLKMLNHHILVNNNQMQSLQPFITKMSE